MISKGADVNRSNHRKKNPLDYAIKNFNSLKFIELLFSSGAKIKLLDRNNNFLLHYLIQKKNLKLLKLFL